MACLCAAGLSLFRGFTEEHYPLEHWYFWRLATYWVASALFGVSAVSAGHVTVRWVLGRELPPFEQLALAFAVGVLEFELAMFLGGALSLFSAWFFFVPPALMLLVGLPKLIAFFAAHKGRWFDTALGPRHVALLLFGVVNLGFIYFTLLSPDNVAYDARWMHLGIAEDYAAAGGLRRFPEGWIFAGAPHLGSMLYTWAFLVPRGDLYDHMVLCQHLEMVVFLGTTFLGIGALVRRLVPHADVRVVWVARFLFPGVLLYDSSLSGGADHLSAMYGPAIFLALLRTWPRLDTRSSALLGALIAGATMTKYTLAIMLLPSLTVALTLRVVLLAVAAFRERARTGRLELGWLRGPAALVGVGLLVGAPHWLKNLVHYGDPAYPLLHRFTSPRPWSQDAAELYQHGFSTGLWAATHDLSGLLDSLEASVKFSFEPNDWPRFHGEKPVFGSLYTLLLPGVVFLQRRRRALGVVLSVQVGLVAWYWVNHQDRYLQALAPLMAAVVAAVLLEIWRTRSALARLSAGALVLYQVVWGGDVYFFNTHSMTGSPQKDVLDLLAAGHAEKYDERYAINRSTFRKIGDQLPDRARVVVHDHLMTVGFSAEIIHDARPWQFGLDYGVHTPAGVYDQLVALGATHLAWDRSDSPRSDSVAGEAMFHLFANRYGEDITPVSGWAFAKMPIRRPEGADAVVPVLVIACGKRGYASGLYEMPDLATSRYGPRALSLPPPRTPAQSVDAAWMYLPKAEVVVIDKACARKADPGLSGGFVRVTKVKAKRELPEYHFWLRKPARTADEDDGADEDDRAREGDDGEEAERPDPGGDEPSPKAKGGKKPDPASRAQPSPLEDDEDEDEDTPDDDGER